MNESSIEKRKNTWKNKYGVDNVTHLDYVNEIRIEGNKKRSKNQRLKNYSDAPSLDKEVKLIHKETGEVKILKKIEFIEKNWKDWKWEFICSDCCLKKTISTYHVYVKKVIYDDEICPSCKSKKTNLKKYGVENPAMLEETKKKVRQTNLKKYGVEYTHQNKKFLENVNNKRNKTSFKKYLKKYENILTPMFKEEEYSGSEYNKKYKWKCKTCEKVFEDHVYSGHVPRCPICNPKVGRCESNYEKEIIGFIESLGIKDIKENDRSILNGKELDIYLPNYNLAIEFNGIYWHSELQGKNKDYHLNKTIECEKKGIKLLHIFEDEWVDKQEIVKSIIKARLGIIKNKVYARKCIIKELGNEEAEFFLNTRHIQGYAPARVKIGLYYEGELVSLLTFGKPRFSKNYDWEIVRFVNNFETSVIGGFSKMLKYFRNNYSGSIITYSDRRIFDGSIYENNGFKKLKSSKPGYYYTDHNSRYNRQQFQKHKLKDKLETFDSNLTEWENMQLNGWDRIWDCGNNVFLME